MRRLSDIVFCQQALSLPPGTSAQEACEAMRARSVGSVLVVDGDGGLLGIVTGRDIVHRLVAEARDATSTTLSDIMTAQPTTLPPQRTAVDALRLMWECGCRHLPVVDGNKLLGVVSRGDFRGSETDRLDEERQLWEHLR